MQLTKCQDSGCDRSASTAGAAQIYCLGQPSGVSDGQLKLRPTPLEFWGNPVFRVGINQCNCLENSSATWEGEHRVPDQGCSGSLQESMYSRTSGLYTLRCLHNHVLKILQALPHTSGEATIRSRATGLIYIQVTSYSLSRLSLRIQEHTQRSQQLRKAMNLKASKGWVVYWRVWRDNGKAEIISKTIKNKTSKQKQTNKHCPKSSKFM